MKKILAVGLLFCCISAVSSAVTVQGIDLDFVTIGEAGNHADSTGHGAVGYTYQIGKYEITASQWQTINSAAGIGEPGCWSGDQPIADIYCYDAARFCNYLTTGNTETGVYTFTSGTLTSILDHETAGSTYGRAYFLPTEDEWYKAAYYTVPEYSLYSNGRHSIADPDWGWNYRGGAYSSPWDVGTGEEEQNGTFDMMGNVWEWNETAFLVGHYGFRGGSYESSVDKLRSVYEGGILGDEYDKYVQIGFRIASIPEPATMILLGLGGLFLRHKK